MQVLRKKNAVGQAEGCQRGNQPTLAHTSASAPKCGGCLWDRRRQVSQHCSDITGGPLFCSEGGGSTTLSDHLWSEGQLGTSPDIPSLSSGGQSKTVCAIDLRDSVGMLKQMRCAYGCDPKVRGVLVCKVLDNLEATGSLRCREHGSVTAL